MKPHVLDPEAFNPLFAGYKGPYAISFDDLERILPGILEQPDLAISMPMRMVNGHTTHQELQILCNLLYWSAKQTERGGQFRALEIGTFDGLTTHAFAQTLDTYNTLTGAGLDWRVYTIDLPEGTESVEPADGLNAVYTTVGVDSLKRKIGWRYSHFPHRSRIQQIRQDTMTLDPVDHPELHDVDFVFVDANHDYTHTKNDQDLASRLARDGALVVQHDYGKAYDWPGVVHALSERAHEGTRYFWLGGTGDPETSLVMRVNEK